MSTPVLELRATESHDVTVVRAVDAQRILDDAEHAERPYAAWAKRRRRQSRVSFDDLDEVTVTTIAGPTFELGRLSTRSRRSAPLAQSAMLPPSVSGEVRAHVATGAVALLILLLTCAALSRVDGAEAESGPPRVTASTH